MKKGFMFSLLTLALIIPIIVIMLIEQTSITTQRKLISTELRIEELSELYDSIIRDLEKTLKIIVPRAISASISYVVTNGVGLNSSTDTLKELLINGTLYSEKEALMQNATLPYWTERINYLASLRGFETNVEFDDVYIRPFDSWNILVTVELRINISDPSELVSINRVVNVSEKISIIGFEDPLFPLKTSGRGISVITRSPYEGNYTQLLASSVGNNSWYYGKTFVTDSSMISKIDNKTIVLVVDSVDGVTTSLLNEFSAVVCSCDLPSLTTTYVELVSDATSVIPNNTNVLVDGENGKVWYIENLIDDVKNSYYHSSEKGASFLDRLEGKLEVQEKYKSQTNTTIGLEFFVNKDYILSLGLPVDLEKTNVDHLYFSEASHPGKRVKGLENTKFRIDEEICTDEKTHAEMYQVDELLTE